MLHQFIFISPIQNRDFVYACHMHHSEIQSLDSVDSVDSVKQWKYGYLIETVWWNMFQKCEFLFLNHFCSL